MFKNALLLGNQYTSLKAVHDQVQYFRNTAPFKEKITVPYEEIKKDNYSSSRKLWDIHSFAVKLQCN